MSLICKIYGIVDIIVALIIYFGTSIPYIAKIILVAILLFKGIPSLFG